MNKRTLSKSSRPTTTKPRRQSKAAAGATLPSGRPVPQANPTKLFSKGLSL